MKILAIHSGYSQKPSMVDQWRIQRPLEELAKHVDWQIDHQEVLIPDFEKYKTKEQFTNEEMEAAAKKLGEYDIIFSSYHPDPTGFSLLQVVKDRYGTQFIMDCDDNMFSVNPDNLYWMKVGDLETFQMQRMIVHNDWICTTNERLAKEFINRRRDQTGKSSDSVFVCPNYISDIYRYEPFENKIPVVGYFGGASHYLDVNASGVIKAIKRLKRQGYKFDFHIVGMLLDKTLKKSDYKYFGGESGNKWFDLFPTLHFDISLGPVLNNTFNEGKSNIKWQESTRMGAAFVASNVGPYRELENESTALLVENTPESWLEGLKSLLDHPEYRKGLLENARKELEEKWTLEKNWEIYKLMFEKVYKHGHSHPGSRKRQAVSRSRV